MSSPEALVGSAPELANTSIVPPLTLVSPSSPAGRRWGADGWVLARRGGGSPPAAGGPAAYGASQAGAVLRYRLDPDSAHRPSAYMRASAALNGSGEREIAAGLSARPLARVPIVAAAELRASQLAGGSFSARPAAFLVTELPPVQLGSGVRAEVYAQAGYVGGAAATAFADGQGRVDTPLARLGRAEVRAGGGLWGGAQEGAARLDIGPSVMVQVPLAGGFSRLSADWRVRVAGQASPGSGPALTLSAGF